MERNRAESTQGSGGRAGVLQMVRISLIEVALKQKLEKDEETSHAGIRGSSSGSVLATQETTRWSSAGMAK
jgi:hypothetical protein